MIPSRTRRRNTPSFVLLNLTVVLEYVYNDDATHDLDMSTCVQCAARSYSFVLEYYEYSSTKFSILVLNLVLRSNMHPSAARIAELNLERYNFLDWKSR